MYITRSFEAYLYKCVHVSLFLIITCINGLLSFDERSEKHYIGFYLIMFLQILPKQNCLLWKK